MHRKQHIKQLNSGEKYETIQRPRDTNTRLLRAEALADAEDDGPLLSCSVLLASPPEFRQIPCCAHAVPPRSFPFCFAGCPSTVIPPLPRHRRAENCSLPQLKKLILKSLTQCKHVQRGSAREYKTVALLAHAILPGLLSRLPVSGRRRLRLDGFALCCCWCTRKFHHCSVGSK